LCVFVNGECVCVCVWCVCVGCLCLCLVSACVCARASLSHAQFAYTHPVAGAEAADGGAAPSPLDVYDSDRLVRAAARARQTVKALETWVAVRRRGVVLAHARPSQLTRFCSVFVCLCVCVNLRACVCVCAWALGAFGTMGRPCCARYVMMSPIALDGAARVIVRTRRVRRRTSRDA
jgi:hypothetical protein